MDTDNLLTELEPVEINSQTHVKVPVNMANLKNEKELNDIQSTLTLPESDISLMPNSNKVYTFSARIQLEFNDNSDLTEVHRLQTLLDDLPSGMFIDQLLLDYKNSETKLEHTRQMLFEIIRQSDDYPYNRDIELKRRVKTRYGEPVATKLGRDIHMLLSVVEGDDYQTSVELLSASKSIRTHYSSLTEMSSDVSTAASCLCKKETDLLKDTVSSLQSEILQMKQKKAAEEIDRISEIKGLHSSIDDLKHELNKYVAKEESSISDERIRCKSEQLKQNSHIHSLQTFMLGIRTTVDTLQKGVNDCYSKIYSTRVQSSSPENAYRSSGKDHFARPELDVHLKNTLEASSVNSSQVTPDPSCERTRVPEMAQQSNAPTNDQTYADVTRNSPQLLQNKEGEHSIQKQHHIPTIVSNRIPSKQNQNIQWRNNARRQPQKRDVNFHIINKELAASKDNKLREFQVHYNRYRPDEDTSYQDYGDESNCEEDFEQYVRKRPKRFYVGGFGPKITETKIASYIRRRGPKVTKVTIFRKARFGSVVIRVNVEDDENADNMVEEQFWPRGITCRPWLSYGSYRGRFDRNETYGTERNRNISKNYRTDDWFQREFHSVNRYEGLDIDIDD